MSLNIKSTNLALTDVIKNYLSKKTDYIKKILSPKEEDSIRLDIEIGKISNHHKKGDIFKAEINCLLGKKMLRSIGEKNDLYAAIDEARDEIVREIKSFKEKRRSKTRLGGRKIKEDILIEK